MHIATFQFSFVRETRLTKRGSEEHANGVFEIAKSWLGRLNPENIFLPDVLAIVEHMPSKRFFVGASIAVSDFLRPICLRNRIINLKEKLGGAVIHFCTLNDPIRHDLRFSYAFKTQRYDSLTPGLPCQNCKTLFQGDRSGRGEPTILGACAEYCAVNELLPEEITLKHSRNKRVNSKVEGNFKQCITLLKNYRDMSERCITTFENGNQNEMETLYLQVKYLFPTFGLRPEFNRCFSQDTEPVNNR